MVQMRQHVKAYKLVYPWACVPYFIWGCPTLTGQGGECFELQYHHQH